MMPSRGMGDINPSKLESIRKKDGGTVAKDMKKLFAGKETKKEEKAEKKAFPTKAGYKAAEMKFEKETVKLAKGGMGGIDPAKIKVIRKKDGDAPVTVYKKGGKTSSPKPSSVMKRKKP